MYLCNCLHVTFRYNENRIITKWLFIDLYNNSSYEVTGYAIYLVYEGCTYRARRS